MAAVDGRPIAAGIAAGNVWLRTANIGFEQEPGRVFRLFSCRHEPPANRGSQGTTSPALSALPARDQLIQFYGEGIGWLPFAAPPGSTF